MERLTFWKREAEKSMYNLLIGCDLENKIKKAGSKVDGRTANPERLLQDGLLFLKYFYQNSPEALDTIKRLTPIYFPELNSC